MLKATDYRRTITMSSTLVTLKQKLRTQEQKLSTSISASSRTRTMLNASSAVSHRYNTISPHHSSVLMTACLQGGPIKTAHFWNTIFLQPLQIEACGFCWRVQKLKQKTTSEQFFKQVLNILCKVTGNGPRRTRLLGDDQPELGRHCHRPVLKTTYPGHSCSRWTHWASPELGLICHTRIVTKLCGILQS